MNTPYVPPLMFYYLTNPPQAVYNDSRKIVDNRFYQMVVNTFRDRIYINAHYQSNEPLDRPMLLSIIGFKDMAKTFLVFLAVFFWFSVVTFRGLDFWLYSWERFTIPFVAYFSMYTVMKIQAYLEMRYMKMDRVISNHLGEPEPRITWRELFPDQDRGKIILAAWEAECEKRERYRNMVYSNTPITHQQNNHPLAPYPYPSSNLPNWLDDMDAYYEQKLDQWVADENRKKKSKPTTSKVVDINKRRKPS
jgi:hypothetical protein